MGRFAVGVEMRIYKTIFVDAADDEEAYNQAKAELENNNIPFSFVSDDSEWEIVDVWED